MGDDYLKVFIPVIALVVDVIIQIIISRYFSKSGLLNSIFLGFLAGLFSLFLLESCIFLTGLILLKEFIALFITDLITYASLGYCYFHFLNLGETARRIRILRELRESSAGLSLNEILTRYNAEEIIERRILRLIKNGQIIFKNDKYHIGNPAVLLAARFLITLKFILLGKKYNL